MILTMITSGKGEIIFRRFENIFPPVQVVLIHNHLEQDEDDDDDDDDAEIGEAKEGFDANQRILH